MTKPLDPEIKALRAVRRALQPLSIDARDRALVWAVGAERGEAVTEPLLPKGSVTITVGGKVVTWPSRRRRREVEQLERKDRQSSEQKEGER